MPPFPDEAAVFNAARKLPTPADRRTFLDAACGADTPLRERVARLLAAHDADSGFLAGSGHPADTPTPAAAAFESLLGTAVGPYTLTAVIGQGGMGTVYRAEQTDPVCRAVAVKVIRAGLGGHAVTARFAAERSALARMEHPHIARVLDAGSTPDGRPYFAMELVAGVPITDFCDAAKLPVPDRLRLFGQVCRAVQHAHQKGVIHRDLKPSNVLVAEVDGRPLAKVIDFGIAKATDAATGSPAVTHLGTLVGTLAYMSPEQAEFDNPDIDTRADVYALGAILYELLTGTPPFPADPTAVNPLRQLKTLREMDPDRPTTRLRVGDRVAAAAARGTTPAALDRQVRGDLDWIVVKCLEKDRGRRYDSAAALADDVDRHLRGEPVTAAPPTAGYRVRKFVRRNRGAVLAVAAVAVALVSGTVATGVQAVRAIRAEADAHREAGRAGEAEQVAALEAARASDAEADTDAFARFLVKRVLGAARPQGVAYGIGVDVTLSKALAAAEPAVAAEFAGRPRAEAAARLALGTTWQSLGRYDLGEPHLRAAVRLCEGQYGPADDRTLDALGKLSVCLVETGQPKEAVGLLDRQTQGYVTRYGPTDGRTLDARKELGVAYRAAGRLTDAVNTLEAALADQRTALGPAHPTTLSTMAQLGNTFRQVGRRTDAIRLLTESADGSEAALGPADVRTIGAVNMLVFALTAADMSSQAVPRGRANLTAATAALGADHPARLQTEMVLANALSQGGKPTEAVPLLEDVVKRGRTALPDSNPLMLEALNNLALAYQRANRLPDALPLMADLRGRMIRLHGATDPNTLIVTFNLGRFHNLAGRSADGLPYLREAADGMKAVLGPTHPHRVHALTALAFALRATGQPAAVGPVLRELVAVQRVNLPDNSPKLSEVIGQLGQWLLDNGDPAAAVPLLREALTIRQAAEPKLPTTFQTMTWLGDALARSGDPAAAEPLLVDGYKGLTAGYTAGKNPARDAAIAAAGRRVVALYTAWGKPAEVRAWSARVGIVEPAPLPRPVAD